MFNVGFICQQLLRTPWVSQETEPHPEHNKLFPCVKDTSQGCQERFQFVFQNEVVI